MSGCTRGEVIRALSRMAKGADEHGHYSFSRIDAAWVLEAVDMLCSDHDQLELIRADSATAWDKCEERRLNEERLRDALKFYADPKTYEREYLGFKEGFGEQYTIPPFKDDLHGEKARAALALSSQQGNCK